MLAAVLTRDVDMDDISDDVGRAVNVWSWYSVAVRFQLIHVAVKTRFWCASS